MSAAGLSLEDIRKPEMSRLRYSQHLRHSGVCVTYVTSGAKSIPQEPPECLKCCEHLKRDISGFLME